MRLEQTNVKERKHIAVMKHKGKFIIDNQDITGKSNYGMSTTVTTTASPTKNNKRRNESKNKNKNSSGNCLTVLLIVILLLAAICYAIYCFTLISRKSYLNNYISNSTLGIYKRAAVSTDAWPCAKIGKDLLAKNGTAIDATIGILLCKALVIPNSSGLGGGCIITVYDAKTKTATVIDGREEAPDYATENMFGNNSQAASRGPLSIGIPGELAAYAKAHKLFGKLPWPELFEPVIEMAENGVPLVEHMHDALRNKNHAQFVTPKMQAFFRNNATGQYYKLGDIVKYPILAKTLRRLAIEGSDDFYRGEIGRILIEDLQEQGGLITRDNLAKYQARVSKAEEFELNSNLKLFTTPIPSSGIILSIIMRIMDKLGYYNGDKRPKSSFKAATLFHYHFTEACKFAYAERALLEDKPDNITRMSELITKLKSDEYIDNVVSRITDTTHDDISYYNRQTGKQAFDSGTAHVSVVDDAGNAVSATTSVNLYFGSGLISPRTGIIYNDVMDDFVSPGFSNSFGIAASAFNHIRPGRRPISSMAPSVFIGNDNSVKLVIGASGGAKITSSVAYVSLRTLFLKDDIKTAIDADRIHHQLQPNELQYERNFSSQILKSLHDDYKHKLAVIVNRSSVVMGIVEENLGDNVKVLTANSDYRKGGAVDGI